MQEVPRMDLTHLLDPILQLVDIRPKRPFPPMVVLMVAVPMLVLLMQEVHMQVFNHLLVYLQEHLLSIAASEEPTPAVTTVELLQGITSVAYFL